MRLGSTAAHQTEVQCSGAPALRHGEKDTDPLPSAEGWIVLAEPRVSDPARRPIGVTLDGPPQRHDAAYLDHFFLPTNFT
jgi:hypothetical protein